VTQDHSHGDAVVSVTKALACSERAAGLVDTSTRPPDSRRGAGGTMAAWTPSP
jgi:hypothetical protein